MISKTELLKTAARAAYFVLSRAVFAGVFGGVCNLVFAALLWPEIKTLAFRFVPNLPHGGGAVALVILAVMALPALSLAALFLLGFPVAYFLLGKKYGIGVAISKELAARKDVLLAYFFDRLFAAISARTDWLDQFKRGGIAAIVREVLPQFLAKLPGMPAPMRWLLRAALGKIGLDALAGVLTENGGIQSLELSALSEPLLNKASALIDDTLPSPSKKPFLVLFAVNIGAFVLAKVWL